tara:strand:- start:176 stop:529 length:354 start_codon:yes stop_codon:yes gene_type:complete
MNKFNELNNRVITWANSKNILTNGNPLAQIDKTLEEVLETKEALFAQHNYIEFYKNTKQDANITIDEIKDGFGDILVTVLIGCKMQNINPLECLELALSVIEKRTGKMINGTFVKNK